MEIKFQIKDRVFSICIGRKTQWFEQVWFFAITELFYHNREVYYAELIFTWLESKGVKP